MAVLLNVFLVVAVVIVVISIGNILRVSFDIDIKLPKIICT